MNSLNDLASYLQMHGTKMYLTLPESYYKLEALLRLVNQQSVARGYLPLVDDGELKHFERNFHLWMKRPTNDLYTFTPEIKELLDQILEQYDDYTAKELKDLVRSGQEVIVSDQELDLFEKCVEIGTNWFIYDSRETVLTPSDEETLKVDFGDYVNEEFFVYKEGGELVAY